MKRILFFILSFALIISIVYAETEIRKLGKEDLSWGDPTTTWTSPGGVIVTYIPWYGDNTAAASFWSPLVTITGGSIDNTVIGAATPKNIIASYLTSAGPASFQAGGSISDDQEFAYGTWRSKWDSTNRQMVFYTDNIVGLNDGTPMFIVRAANGGTLETGQEVFAVQDNATSIFKVSQGGNVTITGELIATQIVTSGGDNTHFVNVMNTGPPSSPSKGDCYFDNTLNAWRCYSTSSTWVTSNVEDNSVTPAKLKSSSGTADNTTCYRGDGAWEKTGPSFYVNLDNTYNSSPNAYVLTEANARDAVITNSDVYGSVKVYLKLPQITNANKGRMRVTVSNRLNSPGGINIDPYDANARIRGVTGCTTSNMGDSLESTTNMESVVLVATDTDAWSIISCVGAWADAN